MRVLAIGIATLDIINTVATYPQEDDEIRALSQRIARGGNATNTLVVLSQLGYRCSWLGTLADDPASLLILKDLAKYEIDTSACLHQKGGKSPTSYVTLSRATGSRTIVHFRDLPEYNFQAFSTIDPSQYDWIHFEGRNVEETLQMMQWLWSQDHRPTVSLELEKPRPEIELLLPYANLLLFSQHYAQTFGHQTAQALFTRIRPVNPQGVFVCAWGDQGAWLQTPDSALVHMPALLPNQPVETLGAGDVFNAGMIHGLLQSLTPVESLRQAVQLAGTKCSQIGFDQLALKAHP